MLNSITSSLIILVELIFGVLALLTQRAALRSMNNYDDIIHAIAWAVEVLISSFAFFILALHSTTTFAVIGFIVGVLIIIAGSLMLYLRVKRI